MQILANSSEINVEFNFIPWVPKQKAASLIKPTEIPQAELVIDDDLIPMENKKPERIQSNFKKYILEEEHTNVSNIIQKEISEKKIKRIMKRIVIKNTETNQHIIPFILYKNKFLFKTKNKMKINLCSNIKTQIEHIMFNFIGDPKKRFTNLADLNLVNNEMWLKKFKEYGIDEKKMVVTGNPYWDKYFEIFKQKNL